MLGRRTLNVGCAEQLRVEVYVHTNVCWIYYGASVNSGMHKAVVWYMSICLSCPFVYPIILALCILKTVPFTEKFILELCQELHLTCQGTVCWHL